MGDSVVTCGVKHIRYWTLLGNTLEYKDGEFGRSEAQTLLCIGKFGKLNPKDTTEENNQVCFTGAINGDIIVWKKYRIDRIIQGAHNVCQEIFIFSLIFIFRSGHDLFH